MAENFRTSDAVFDLEVLLTDIRRELPYLSQQNMVDVAGAVDPRLAPHDLASRLLLPLDDGARLRLRRCWALIPKRCDPQRHLDQEVADASFEQWVVPFADIVELLERRLGPTGAKHLLRGLDVETSIRAWLACADETEIWEAFASWRDHQLIDPATHAELLSRWITGRQQI